MVGDREHDVLRRAASTASRCVGARWGYGTARRARRAAGADADLRRAAELLGGCSGLDGRRMLQRPDRARAAQPRLVTLASLRWVLRHRAWTPWYLVRYWRFLRFKLRQPARRHPRLRLPRTAASSSTPGRGYGRLVLGRWVHLGVGTALRCHEGTLQRRRQERCSGRDNVDQLLPRRRDRCGRAVRRQRLRLRLRPQLRRPGPSHQGPGDRQVPGAHRARRVARHQGDGGAGASVIGEGCVVGANAVVTRDLPPYCVAVGVPARVIKDRRRAT